MYPDRNRSSLEKCKNDGARDRAKQPHQVHAVCEPGRDDQENNGRDEYPAECTKYRQGGTAHASEFADGYLAFQLDGDCEEEQGEQAVADKFPKTEV